MIIAIVTEFDTNYNFQWHKTWTPEKQREKGVIVKSVVITDGRLKRYKPSNHYWDWLKNADVVFVYCARRRGEESRKWQWYELPIIVKKFMKRKAKLIVQWDDDLMFVFRSGYSAFDCPKPESPERFFKESGILEIGDMYWTVLEHPPWEQYCKKPIYYMPFPQLANYDTAVFDEIVKDVSILKAHGQSVAVLRHSTTLASVNHTIKNVLEKFKFSITFFGGFTLTKGNEFISKLPSRTYMCLDRTNFMARLFSECFIAIDDNENYIGWSRFVLECALAYIPCISSSYAGKLFFPELYTKGKDYATQNKLIKKLIKDKDFYVRVVKKARKRVLKLMDEDKLCDRFYELIQEMRK